MNRFLPCVALLLACGCEGDEIVCADQLADGHALEIYLNDSVEDCDYQATFEFEGETSDMVCEADGSRCLCTGGTEYGTYRVVRYDPSSDQMVDAIIEVEAAPSPTCFERTPIQSFAPIGPGGAGGE